MSYQRRYPVRDRSYDVRRAISIGTWCRTAEACYSGGAIPTGTRIQVRSYTNAGFRGIEASVWVASQQRYATVSAGILEVLR